MNRIFALIIAVVMSIALGLTPAAVVSPALGLYETQKSFTFAEIDLIYGAGLVYAQTKYDEHDVFVQYVTVNIEDVQVGDLVYSYDTITGEVTQKAVTATFVLESDHINYLTLLDELGREQIIETTDTHPFWVVTDDPDLSRAASSIVDENGVWLYHENVGPTAHGFWVEAKDLREGDVFLGANGELSTLVATERVVFPDGIRVYNFTVDGNHDYFVVAATDDYGQTCVLVHNADCARRFMGRAEYKDVKKHGIIFDEAKKGIPTTTTSIRPENPDAITHLTGARKADYYVDIDIRGLKTLEVQTKQGALEIRILETILPKMIIGGGRVN